MRKESENVRFVRDPQDNTLTAASLIDAIITHQISQPSTHDRQSPASMPRSGDRLFANFQRSSQQQPPPMAHGGGHPQQHIPSGTAIRQQQMQQQHQQPQSNEDKSEDLRSVETKNAQGIAN